MLLFSDNLIEPGCIERSMPFFDDKEIRFVFSSARVGPEPERSHIMYQWRSADGKYPSGEFLSDALRVSGLPVSSCAALFRLESIKKSVSIDIESPTFDDFMDHGAGPDLLTYLITATEYPLVGFLSEPHVFFRMHDDSITMSSMSMVTERYRQARLFFSNHFISKEMADETNMWEWIRYLKRDKTLISFQSFIRRYLTIDVNGFRFTVFWKVLKRYYL